MSRLHAFLLLMPLALISVGVNAAVTSTVVDLPTRGLTQRILYIKPDAPVVNLIALPGADTILDIRDDGTLPTFLGNCFPVARLRDAFTARGFAIALVDSPSDYRWRAPPEAYRIGTEQIADVQEVVRYMQQRADVPTWIIGGTSATNSVVNLAANLPTDLPLGVIFFSIDSPSGQLDPEAIRRPTLIVSPSGNEVRRAQALMDDIGLAPVKELVILHGPRTYDCGNRLFDGLDAEFVETVAGFIDKYNGTLKSGAVSVNYQGLWWRSPAGSESGWGINFAHQGDIIFVTWFTYDLTGRAWWLTMTAAKTAEGVYSGTINQTHGPAFSAVPFSPATVTATAVGTGTLSFTDANTGSFSYTVNGISQVKPITRQVFGPLPTCVFGGQANRAAATNFQDLWWAAPAGVESGWGVNFTHQGDIIFATWFTYDVDGTPLWLSATVNKTAPGVYTGALNRTAGPAFSAVPFLPANVALTNVGTLTITFANGNSASFAYTVALTGPASTMTQTKSIVRQVFRTPGTVCQ
jgi:hypothetical protein